METVTAETIELDYWVPLTQWYRPILDSGEVAWMLDLTEDTVRQYVSRGRDDFPAPAGRHGSSNLWTPDQIYRFIQTKRSKLLPRVPRMYCPLEIAPAAFLGAATYKLHNRGTNADFVVHRWLPGDGRGAITVAYPLAPSTGWTPFMEVLLTELEDVDTVAMVTTDVGLQPRNQGYQPAIGVMQRVDPLTAERLKLPGQLGFGGVLEYGWFDLANLLRRDVPWWAPHLRDSEDMEAWRPGRGVSALRPRSVHYCESTLRDLNLHCPTTDLSRLNDLTDRLNRVCEQPLIEHPLPTGISEPAPGITQAAETVFRLPEEPDYPDLGEMLWLLNQPVDDLSKARKAAAQLPKGTGLSPIAAVVMRVAEPFGDLAREWLTHCVPTDETDSSALGFAILHNELLRGEKFETYLRHPAFRDHSCWIARTTTGVYYVSVGTQVPARGTLVEFAVEPTCGFFRDSTGQVWPLPAPLAGQYYTTGHAGGGTKALLRTICALTVDAGRSTSMRWPDAPQPPKLWEHITRTTPPTQVSAAHLTELMATEA